jgi:hypothetical protein
MKETGARLHGVNEVHLMNVGFYLPNFWETIEDAHLRTAFRSVDRITG